MPPKTRATAEQSHATARLPFWKLGRDWGLDTAGPSRTWPSAESTSRMRRAAQCANRVVAQWRSWSGRTAEHPATERAVIFALGAGGKTPLLRSYGVAVVQLSQAS